MSRSYIVPSQLLPFFKNPFLHWQVYDPSVFLHSELSIVLHGSSGTHSLISAKRGYGVNVICIHQWNKTYFSHPVRISTVKCVLNKYSVSASNLVSTDFNQKVKSLRNEVENRGKGRVLSQGHRHTVTSQYPRG